jgi:hypothetical protein
MRFKAHFFGFKVIMEFIEKKSPERMWINFK